MCCVLSEMFETFVVQTTTEKRLAYRLGQQTGQGQLPGPLPSGPRVRWRPVGQPGSQANLAANLAASQAARQPSSQPGGQAAARPLTVAAPQLLLMNPLGPPGRATGLVRSQSMYILIQL